MTMGSRFDINLLKQRDISIIQKEASLLKLEISLFLNK